MKYSLKSCSLLFIVIMFSYFNGTSQNTTHMETFNASGENALGSAGSVSYSIGQVFFTYIGESVYNVAEGVQQSNETNNEKNNRPEDVKFSEVDMVVYPNPTVDFVNLSMKGIDLKNGPNSYQLFSYQGKLLEQHNIDETNTEINLRHLSSSMYVLQVYVNNKILKTFKILKN